MAGDQRNGQRNGKSLPKLQIKVIIYDKDGDTPIREHETNFNNPKCTEWLTKTLIWAFHNHKIVELLNVEDDC